MGTVRTFRYYRLLGKELLSLRSEGSYYLCQILMLKS